MPTSAEINTISEIFVSLLTRNPARLANGSRLREEMHEQIKSGIKPEGYRPDWVRSSALRILQELVKLGQDFNENHPSDKASVNDLLDILNTVAGRIKKYLNDDEE